MKQTTQYSIIDDHGESTTISIDKWVADILQEHLNDVHQYIQDCFDRVTEKSPEVGRVTRGNWVRLMAFLKACPYVKDFFTKE